jgi:hypothetical protein
VGLPRCAKLLARARLSCSAHDAVGLALAIGESGATMMAEGWPAAVMCAGRAWPFLFSMCKS